MTDEPIPDSDVARRVDRPSSSPEDLPYDEELTEPDEANAPDVGERTRTGDKQLGTPDEPR
jgi:hypothetical protein